MADGLISFTTLKRMVLSLLQPKIGRPYLYYGLKTDGLIFTTALKTDGLIFTTALKRMVLSLLRP